MADETTTVEVTHEVWSALDKRKDRGESFDSVIRRLINQTAAPVGAIETDSAIETVEIEELDDAPAGATCSYYDTIEQDTCGEQAAYLEKVAYDDGEPQELYLCEHHGGPVDD